MHACDDNDYRSDQVAMEGKFKNLEAEVTAKCQAQAELEKEHNVLKSWVRMRVVMKFRAGNQCKK
jgi:hypothetical protein